MSGQHGFLQLVEGVFFQLADALGGDIEARSQFMQGALVLAQPAFLQDDAAALIQLFECLDQVVGIAVAPVVLFHAECRIVGGIGQVGGRGIADGCHRRHR